MYNTTFLRNGSKIEMTNSAMVLEKLIGQFIYSIKKSATDNDKNDKTEGVTHETT